MQTISRSFPRSCHSASRGAVSSTSLGRGQATGTPPCTEAPSTCVCPNVLHQEQLCFVESFFSFYQEKSHRSWLCLDVFSWFMFTDLQALSQPHLPKQSPRSLVPDALGCVFFRTGSSIHKPFSGGTVPLQLRPCSPTSPPRVLLCFKPILLQLACRKPIFLVF